MIAFLQKNQILSILKFIILFASFTAQAQEVIPARIIYPTSSDSSIIRGNMRVIGNSVLGVNNDFNDGTGGVTSIRPNDDFNFVNNNDGINRGYIDIDSDPAFNAVFNPALPASERNYGGTITINGNGTPTNTDLTPEDAIGTFSSSSAELIINNPLSPTGQSCSRIQKAFLFWSAIYPSESDGDTIIPRPNCDGCEKYTDIKILPPNATEYIDIKFNPDTTLPAHLTLKSEVIIDGLSNSPYFNPIYIEDQRAPYVCKADITPLMLELQNAAQDVEGFWTVANIRALNGTEVFGGGAAGWSIVVIYEDPFETQKTITLFEGFSFIQPDALPVPFSVSGFPETPAGPVNVQLATIGLEGDRGLGGDELQIRNTAGTFVPLSFPGQSATNFFDSSISVPAGTPPLRRFPNSTNTLGYDSDHFFIDNQGNTLIGNNQTSADFQLFTNRDSYFNFFNAVAVDVIAPDLQVVKRIFNIDGTPFIQGTPLIEGQGIKYSITITNTGNDDAVNVSFINTLPLDTNFDLAAKEVFLDGKLIDPAIITTSNSPVTENVFDNLENIISTIDFPRTQFELPIPNGKLDVGESVLIEFEVQVITNCQTLRSTCDNIIENLTEVNYSGILNNTSFAAQGVFGFDACINPNTEAFLFLESSPGFCETEALAITQCTNRVSLQAGLGFMNYEWFLDENTNGIAEPEELITNDANNNPITNTANNILVNTSGNYIVRQTSNTPCLDVRQRFEVTIFDPTTIPADPIAALGTKLPACEDNGISITQILLCNSPINIPTNFPLGTTYLWQVYDDTNASCSTPSSNCPFTGTTCYIPVPGGSSVSEAASYTLATAGEYQLSVETPGGCLFDYYFNGVEIVDVNPVLNLTGGGCKGDVTATVTGVPTSGVPVNYNIFFEILDNNGMVLSRQSSNTSDPTTFTINRPNPATNVIIRAVVEPDIVGFTTNGSCVFKTEEEIAEFNTVTLDTPIVTQALCPFDDPTTLSFNESRATINVQATGGNPTYIFNLINRTTGALVTTSNTITDNNFTFTNVIPGVDYDVVVVPQGITDSTDLCADRINVPALLARSEFDGTLNITPLTCNPAEIEITLSSTNIDPDFNAFSYSIVEIPGNTYSGQTSTIFVDDIVNQPPPVVDGDPVPPGLVEIINYIDLSTITTLTIRISDSQGCSIDRPFTLEPYDPISATSIQITQSESISEEASIDFDVSGGSPPYNYEVINSATSDVVIAKTATGPPFFFNSTFDGVELEIIVTDTNGCEINNPIKFTPSFPSPVLGINDIDDVSNENIALYPNPTLGLVTIGIKVDLIAIFDIKGIKVATFSKTDQFNISHLTSGFYFVSININERTIVKQLIKK